MRVEGISCIKECVKSVTHLVVSLYPIAVLLLAFTSCWPNPEPLPRVQQLQMDVVFSTSPSHLAYSAQQSHCTPEISTQERLCH